MNALDAKDRLLLDLLYRNARLPLKTIAARVGLARSSVRERVARLESSGVIRGYRADVDWPDGGVSPLESAIGAEAVERYDQALARLRPDDRELIIARVELGLTYSEIAAAVDKPSANAARMAVARALMSLAEVMGENDGTSD